MMNEQTPAWACPICSKTLRVEDISVDGSASLPFPFFLLDP